MKTSSSSAASTLTYESDLSRTSAYLNVYGKSCEEARLFDLVLKKLETVRSGHREEGRQPRNDLRDSNDGDDDDDSDSSDGSEDLRCRFSRHLPVRRSERRTSEDRVVCKSVEADRVVENSFSEEKLPQAILRLDRRHAIPRPRQKNDVLVEIEVRCHLT